VWSYQITIQDYGTVNIEAMSQLLKVDESLDTALLTIPRINKGTPFKRYKVIQITVNDGTNTETTYWKIYADKFEISNHASVDNYTHTLQLMEPIKYLEKFQCGSLTDTQPIDGLSTKTLYDVVSRLCLLVPFERLDDISTTRIFEIETSLATYLNTIKSPQFYFDKKNLREALIGVFRYINAMPRIIYNDLSGTMILTADFVNDLNHKIDISNVPITELNILDYVSETNGEQYSQEVESYQENIIPSDDLITPAVSEGSITDYISFRSSDILVSDSNFYLKTSHKISELISIKTLIATSTQSRLVDLTDWVVNKDVYDTYDTDNAGSADKGYKSASAYWERGSDIMDGFSTTYGWLSTIIAVENMITLALYEQYGETPLYVTWGNLAFLVEYIPFVETSRSVQYREDINEIDQPSSIQINPDERIANAYKSAMNLYGQIQRIGVDTIAFSKKHKTLHTYDETHTDGIYSFGDYTNDGYIITSIEKIYFNSYLIARYEASKHFNRLSQFIDVDKEYRPYEMSLQKSDYTLKRDIYFPLFYIEISDTVDTTRYTGDLVDNFMKTFKTSTYDERLASVLFQHGTIASGYGSEGVLVPCLTYAEKNTLVFKFDFQDTKLAGNRVIYDNPRNVMKGVYYTEDDGTIKTCKMSFYKNYWDETAAITAGLYVKQRLLHYTANRWPYVDLNVDLVAYDNSAVENIYAEDVHWYASVSVFPGTGIDGDYYASTSELTLWVYTTASGYTKVSDWIVLTRNDPVFTSDSYAIYKDGAEILGGNCALPMLPKKTRIETFILGDAVSKENCLIKKRDTAKTFYFYYSNTRFIKSDSAKILTNITVYTPTILSNFISVPADIYNNYDYYALGDADGNMYVAVNQRNLDGTKTTISQIFFNFLKARS